MASDKLLSKGPMEGTQVFLWLPLQFNAPWHRLIGQTGTISQPKVHISSPEKTFYKLSLSFIALRLLKESTKKMVITRHRAREPNRWASQRVRMLLHLRGRGRSRRDRGSWVESGATFSWESRLQSRCAPWEWEFDLSSRPTLIKKNSSFSIFQSCKDYEN